MTMNCPNCGHTARARHTEHYPSVSVPVTNDSTPRHEIIEQREYTCWQCRHTWQLTRWYAEYAEQIDNLEKMP